MHCQLWCSALRPHEPMLHLARPLMAVLQRQVLSLAVVYVGTLHCAGLTVLGQPAPLSPNLAHTGAGRCAAQDR